MDCHRISGGVDYAWFARVGVPEDEGVCTGEDVTLAIWSDLAMGTKILVDVTIEASSTACAGLVGAESDVGVVIGGSSRPSKLICDISGA